MGKLRDAMLMDLQLKGYSPNTVEAYLQSVTAFVRFFRKSPDQLYEKDIRHYLHYLITGRNISFSRVNIAYSALKYFYTNILKRKWYIEKLPHPKLSRKLPVVLDKLEIMHLLEVTTNFKHRVIFETTYSAGLRLAESAHLKVSDIDSKRMQIRVDQGKGNKDRYTILSDVLLKDLRQYYQKYRPIDFLFYGANKYHPISVSSIQMAFMRAKIKAGIKKAASVHTLRHSFATHLSEAGEDIFRIKQLLGHKNIHPTMVYLHVRRQKTVKIASPFDDLLDNKSDER